MRQCCLALSIFALTVVLTTPALAAARPEHGASDPPDALDSIAWLVGGTWTSRSDEPDGTVVNRIHYEWTLGGKAIRYTITREKRGQIAPSHEGLCAVRPDEQRVALFEADHKGNVTEGWITAAEGRITTEEVIYGADGSTLPVRVELVRTGPDTFTFDALVERKGSWGAVFEATYTRE